MVTVHPVSLERAARLQQYARAAGIAMLLSIVFGFLGEMYLPGKIIVAGDATATAANIVGNPMLFRLTFASYLVEAICDVALIVLFYILLEPVDRDLALLTAFFGIVATVTFAVAQSSFFAASIILRESASMTAFTNEQRNALALLATRIGATIAWLFLCMYGIATTLRGYLITRSRYLPRILGILFMIGGAGFFLRSVTYLLAPAYSSGLLLMPMALASLPMTIWLLARGLDRSALVGRSGFVRP
jgi:hypothetical protein